MVGGLIPSLVQDRRDWCSPRILCLFFSVFWLHVKVVYMVFPCECSSIWSFEARNISRSKNHQLFAGTRQNVTFLHSIIKGKFKHLHYAILVVIPKQNRKTEKIIDTGRRKSSTILGSCWRLFQLRTRNSDTVGKWLLCYYGSDSLFFKIL